MKKITYIPHRACTACGACLNICPTGSIRMSLDEEKFYYPVIDEMSCIHCSKCEKVCPITKKGSGNDVDVSESFFAEAHQGKEAYAVIIKDKNIRENSSSGGLFTLFAAYILDLGGIVFGAAISDDCRKVRHIYVENKENLYKLRGSKYVQSSMEVTFKKVKDSLAGGRYVLFTGTPCQVAGLMSFCEGGGG